MNTKRSHDHAARRKALARRIGNGVALFFNPGMDEVSAGELFRPDPDMMYLAGMDEPDSALALVARKGQVASETLHCRLRDPVYERWNGDLMGPQRAKRKLGFKDVRAWEGIDKIVAGCLAEHSDVHVRLSPDRHWFKRCLRTLEARKGRTPSALFDAGHHLAEMRMVKDSSECDAIARSCSLAAEAIENAARKIAGAATEAQVAAQLDQTYVARGAQHAFHPIVACGRNACIAHYQKNASRLRPGQLVLIDTGCRLGGYTSDITRVYPVSGRFTPAQRDMYEIVCEAQRQAISKIRPGVSMDAANAAASRVLAQGLKDLGICKGSVQSILASPTLARYYFHSIGHMLGMEVHDPFVREKPDGKTTKLAAGMVVTIEPGLYLDRSTSVPIELRSTGIRIEDTVQVTDRGRKVLTAAAAKKPDQVEGLFW